MSRKQDGRPAMGRLLDDTIGGNEALKKQVASNPFSVLDDDESGDVGAAEAPPMVLHADIPTPQTGAPTYGTSSQGPTTTIGAGKGTKWQGDEGNVGLSYPEGEKPPSVGVVSGRYAHPSELAEDKGEVQEGVVVEGAGVP